MNLAEETFIFIDNEKIKLLKNVIKILCLPLRLGYLFQFILFKVLIANT